MEGREQYLAYKGKSIYKENCWQLPMPNMLHMRGNCNTYIMERPNSLWDVDRGKVQLKNRQYMGRFYGDLEEIVGKVEESKSGSDC